MLIELKRNKLFISLIQGAAESIPQYYSTRKPRKKNKGKKKINGKKNGNET